MTETSESGKPNLKELANLIAKEGSNNQRNFNQLINKTYIDGNRKVNIRYEFNGNLDKYTGNKHGVWHINVEAFTRQSQYHPWVPVRNMGPTNGHLIIDHIKLYRDY